MRQIIFDLETKQIFTDVGGYYPEKLGVSFLGAIERLGLPEAGPVTETRHQFFESDLSHFFPLLNQADLIVGYNLLGFDLPALSVYGQIDLDTLPILDLFLEIKNQAGRRVSLDAVVSQTLGVHKSGVGLDAIKYYQQSDLASLAAYCLKDVEITRDLYDFGRRHGYVKFLNHWNNPVELPVNFNFSPRSNGTQLSLV